MDLNKQKDDIKQLKNQITEAKKESEELQVEFRRQKAIEHERIKEVKANQKKLQIFIKQSESVKRDKGLLDDNNQCEIYINERSKMSLNERKSFQKNRRLSNA